MILKNAGQYYKTQYLLKKNKLQYLNKYTYTFITYYN